MAHGSRTISLSDSAYERLKAAKLPGESFSDVVHRLLSVREPSFSDLRGILDPKTAERVREVIAQMKEEDIRRVREKYGLRP